MNEEVRYVEKELYRPAKRMECSEMKVSEECCGML
jgi:hypothetical protein